jgi:hypothetical protein
MLKAKVNSPMWPSVWAQLEAVNLTPLERQRARLSLQRAEQLLDLVFALEALLKRRLAAPGRRRSARWPLTRPESQGQRP